MTERAYPGSELEIFQHAQRWKEYFASLLHPYVRGDVAEVGAGIGAITKLFANAPVDSWTCIEPDPALLRELETALAPRIEGGRVRCVAGTLEDADPHARFDSLLYIDVLEHIKDDVAELQRATHRLKPGGSLIVLAPAHDFLYSEFDRAIGHERRYNRRSLAAAAPAGLTCVRMQYLDSVGMLASLANRFWLRQQNPTQAQIAFWDRRIVPLSRFIDPWLGYRLGKSLLGIWQKR